MEVLEAYTANEMSTHAHGFHRTWPVAINAGIKRFSTGKMVHEAHNLMIQVSQRPNNDELEFEFQGTEAICKFHHIFSAIEKVSY